MSPATLVLLAACAPAPAGDSGDAALPGLATIEGVVTRSAPVQGDGIGTLMVGLFFSPVGDPLPVPLWGWSREDVDVTADDFSIRYQLSNIFPQDEPYYVAAIFDDDSDMVIGPDLYPSRGDLLSVSLSAGGIPPISVPTGGTHTLDLDLAAVSTIDWGPSDGGSGSGSGGGGEGGGSGGTGEVGDGTIVVTLEAALEPTHDLVGDAHIWLFEADPRETAQAPVFQAAGVPVDLSAAGAVATFTLEDVPTRAEPMVVVAYLDVDGSGAGGPTPGDPIALDAGDLPTLLVADADPVPLSLRLSDRSN